MNSRRSSILYISSTAGILIFVSLFSLRVQPALAQDPIPTPTYDPLAQPELPENPTDLEMGRYLFWRHCMPCHGDVGQGLTDEFRTIWEDHANCWDRGCHGNRREDEGFPIPTIIPAIVTEYHLLQFTSENELFEFLKATHPPQYPGYLKDEEYHDIVKILFSMNERVSKEVTAIPTSSPTPTSLPVIVFTSTPGSKQKSTGVSSSTAFLCAFFDIVIVVVGIIWARRKFNKKYD
jgi:hypothetical protein